MAHCITGGDRATASHRAPPYSPRRDAAPRPARDGSGRAPPRRITPPGPAQITREPSRCGTDRPCPSGGTDGISIDAGEGGRIHGREASLVSFASAAAISSQDGARQNCHGGPARITSPSAVHRAMRSTEPVPAKVSSSCRVPTSQSLIASRCATLGNQSSSIRGEVQAEGRVEMAVERFDQLALGGVKQPHQTTLGRSSHQSAIGRNGQ